MNKLQQAFMKITGLDRELEQKAVEISKLRQQQQEAEKYYNQAIYTYVGAGLPITSNNQNIIKNTYELNAIVYSIIDLICTTEANLEYIIMRKGKRPQLIETHDFYDVMALPSAGYTAEVWRYEALAFWLLTGNTYHEMLRPETGANTGKVIDMRGLPAHMMQPVSGGYNQPVKGYTMSVSPAIELPADKVYHNKMFNPDWNSGHQLVGMSPWQAALRLILQSNEGANYMYKSFKNGGARQYLYEDSEHPTMTTTAQAREMKERIASEWRGSDNAQSVVIGAAKLKGIDIGLSPVDMNIIEAGMVTVRDLCNILHVPAELMNDPAHRTYANEKEASKALYTRCILPQAKSSIVKIYNTALATYGDNNLYIAIDTSKIAELQKDIASMISGLASAWWLTANERRKVMDYDKITDPRADELLVPAGLVSSELSDAQLINMTSGEYGGAL